MLTEYAGNVCWKLPESTVIELLSVVSWGKIHRVMCRFNFYVIV